MIGPATTVTAAWTTPDPAWAEALQRALQEPGVRPFVKPDAPWLLLSAPDLAALGANEAGAALVARGFPPVTSRKLHDLVTYLAPLKGLRLERLALSSAAPDRAVVCACRRLRLPGTDVSALLVAAQEAVETLPPPTPPHDAGAQDAGARDAGAHAAVATAAGAPAAEHGEGLSTPAVTEAPAPEPAAPQGPEVLPARAPLPARLRFVWEADASGRFRALPAVIDAVFGPQLGAALSQDGWSIAVSRQVVTDDGAIAAAFAGGATWSSLKSLWRVGASTQALPVTLSAMPVPAPGPERTGWRGFGVIRTDAPSALDFVEEEAATSLTTPVADAPEPAPSPLEPAVDGAEPPARELPAPGAPVPLDPLLALPTPDAVVGTTAPAPEPAEPEAGGNVVPLWAPEPPPRLSHSERNAFREIAKALGARLEGDPTGHTLSPVPGARGPEPADMAAPRLASSPPLPSPLPLPAPVAPADPTSLAPEPAPLPEPPAEHPPAAASAGPEPAAAEAEPPQAAGATIVALPLAAAARSFIDAAAPAPSDERALARDASIAALAERLPIGVLVLREERIVYANRTLIELLDYADLDALCDAGTGRIFSGQGAEAAQGAFTLIRRDGGLEMVDARLSAGHWQGHPATVMSFRRAQETGDRARYEALKLDLARAEGKSRELSAILDTATDGVATMDARGRLLSLNRSAEALFGYDQREVTGENFTLLLAPESHVTALDYLDGLKGGGVASLLNDGREVIGRVRQGGRIPLFMTMGAVGQGEDAIYSAVLRDMTAWKRAEADLIEAKKAAERASAQKSDVLAKISHEIRTPLNAIIGFTEVMSEERFGPIGNERYKEYLSDIRDSGGYLISLINDLLDLAKIEAGRMDLTFTGVNLNEVASAAVQLLQPEANRQRVVLRTGLQTRLPAVVADERSLRQIIINLLSNAVKFTDAGGQVILSTALGDRGEVILRVRDTGVGMTEKELSLAMEPFRQVSATRRGGGTGLGLPITKALVEANKGQLAITSAKNEGTLVEITFPSQRVLAS